MSTVAEAMIDVLAAGGVRRAYTVPGESFLGILEAVDRHPAVRLISTRHESGAAFMAEADAKMSGRPAVAAATRAVGSANLSIGVHTAMHDSTPLVALIGQVQTSFLGKDAFQEIDLAAFFAPITKWAVTASRADRLPELVAEGLRIAQSGRPGPVMIALPVDLLEAAASDAITARATIVAQGTWPKPSVSPALAAEIAAALAGAQRPVVIVGGGCRDAREPLVRLVEHFGLGVYTAYRRQDAFPNNHPQYLGHLGAADPEECLRALKEADLVLVLGSRLSEITAQHYTVPVPGQRVIQVDIDAGVVGKVVPVEIGVVGDAGDVARQILAAAGDAGANARDWSAAKRAYSEWTAMPPARSTSAGFDPVEVIAAMADVLPKDAVIANDAGNFALYLHRYWSYDAPHTQLAPTSGAMGYAVPAAIGGSWSANGRPVVALAGEGGFLMSGQEVETAVRYSIPLTVIVFNNRLYGTIAMHQASTFGRLAGTEIGPVDVAGFARSLGATGVKIANASELRPTLAAAIESQGVTVIEVPIESDLIAPGRRLSEIQPSATRSETH